MYNDNGKKNNTWLLILLVTATILCFWGINFGLPQLLHDDEQAFVKRALRFGSGDLNPHFFFYPTLHMYILFFFYGVYFVFLYIAGYIKTVQEFAYSYIRDPSLIYIIGRSISALGGILSVYLTYRITQRLCGFKRAGVLAGFMLLAVPKLIEISHYIRSDTLMLGGTLLFFNFCLDIYEKGERKYYVLAGLVMGLSCALKYNAIILMPLLFIAHVMRVSTLENFSSTKYKKKIAGVIKSMVDIKVFWYVFFIMVGFSVGVPYWIFDFNTFVRHFTGLVKFTANDTEFGQSGALINYLRLILYIGEYRIFLGLLFFGGSIYGFFAGKKVDKRFFLVIFAIILVIAGCARQRIQQWQYLLPAFPYFAILAAIFMEDVLDKTKNIKMIYYGLLIIIFLVVSDGLLISAVNNYYLSRKDTRNLAKEWVEQNIPPGAKILLDPRGPQLLRSKDLIRKQYILSEQLNNPKKEYFKLQLEAQKGVEYYTYHIARPIVTPPEMKETSQEVELTDTLDIYNLSELKKKGYEYVIIAPPKEVTSEEMFLDKKFCLLKEFSPQHYARPLIFRVKIYKVL